MASEIFVDASAWVAIINPQDANHNRVANFYPRLMAGWARWITSNLVIAETCTLLRYQFGFNNALRFLMLIHNSKKLLKVYADPQLDAAAENILSQYRDQDFSYVDAVSFAVMQHRKITDVLTLDHHFSVMGFTRVI